MMATFDYNIESLLESRGQDSVVSESKVCAPQQIDELIAILEQSKSSVDIISVIHFNPEDQHVFQQKLIETSNLKHLHIIIKCLSNIFQQNQKMSLPLKLLNALDSLTSQVEGAQELLGMILNNQEVNDVIGLINQPEAHANLFNLLLKTAITDNSNLLMLYANQEFKQRLITELDLKNTIAQEFILQSLNHNIPHTDISEIAVQIIDSIIKGPSDFTFHVAASLSGLYPLQISYLIDNKQCLSQLCDTAKSSDANSPQQLSAIIIVKNYLKSKKNANLINQQNVNQLIFKLNKTCNTQLLTLCSHIIAECKRLFSNENQSLIRDSIVANIFNQNPQSLKILLSSLRSLFKTIHQESLVNHFKSTVESVTDLMQELVDSAEPSEQQQIVICINFLGSLFKQVGTNTTKMDVNVALEQIGQLDFIVNLQNHKQTSVRDAAVRVISSYIELEE